MNFHIDILTEAIAKDICEWKYQDEYEVYNLANWDELKDKKFGIADEVIRKKDFRTVYDEDNQLFGYFRMVEKDNIIVLGVGMKPQYCGMGMGKGFIDTIVNYITEQYPKHKIGMFVRPFNKRAIKCYESAGFIVKGTNEALHRDVEFYYMEYIL